MARFRLEDGTVTGDKTAYWFGFGNVFAYVHNEDGNDVLVGSINAPSNPVQAVNLRAVGGNVLGAFVRPITT